MPNPEDPLLDADHLRAWGATTAVEGRNGHGGTSGAPAAARAMRPSGPSTHLALIVLGIALGLFVLGTVAAGLTSSPATPTPENAKVATAPRAGLTAVSARPLLASIVTPGQPPTDLLDAIALPKGARPVASTATNEGVGLYDRSLQFGVAATEDQVIAFFRAQLPFEHWRLVSQGPAHNAPGYMVVGQHPASDGHEWEIGVTVSPTRFSTGAGQSTPFTVRLFAVSDED